MDEGGSCTEASSLIHNPYSAAKPRPPHDAGWLCLTDATHHNLKSVDLHIPLGTLTGVSGPSGSGKSSLIEDTLAAALMKRFHRVGENPGPYGTLRGVENVDKVIAVDQQPIGATPASNPATYTGVFDAIRDLYANLPDAKARGFKPGRFSFNRPGGRCELCEGNGQKLIEMHFLPDVWVECEACRGRRYNAETLSVLYNGATIADVLEMSVGKAAELFAAVPKIRAVLKTLCAIGLDYLTLGQAANTLSGGEAQRVKLAAELAKPATGRTLYLLDEPTTGLHFDDIQKLLKVLQSLVEKGNTVVVTEHNTDVLKCCDWLIDVGPEAGRGGGLIVAEGTPEDVVAQAESYLAAIKAEEPVHDPRLPGVPLRSHTGEHLAEVLEAAPREDVETFDADAEREKAAGDIDVDEVGKLVDSPWKRDGRKWHLEQRLSHRGKPCQWDRRILERLTERLEERSGLKKTKWNHPSTVEVAAKGGKKNGSNGSAAGWFLHAHSQVEHSVRLVFRVPKKTVTEQEVRQAVPLRPLCELAEVDSGDESPRVWTKPLRGPHMEVTLKPRTLEEVDTEGFWSLVDRLTDAFLGVDASKKPSAKEQAAEWVKAKAKRKT